MNSYERYIATIKKEPVDFLPRVPILMQYAAEHIGSNYAAFAADYRVLVEANLRCREDFGFDQVSAISDPYRESEGFGANVMYAKNHAPFCEQTLLADITDLSPLTENPDPYYCERMRDRLMAVRSFKEYLGGECSILGWVEGAAAEAADLRGVQDFFMDIILNAEAACALMELTVKTGIRFALAQLAEGADTIGIGDAIASQMSADMYRELVWPYEKRMVDAIHAQGGLVKLHICGNTTHILPHVAELGVDIFDVDHMVDPKVARATLGSDVVIAGRVDPVQCVLNGTPQTIRAEVLESYAALGDPHMVGAGCEIPAGTPLVNLKALCEPVAP